MNEELYPMFWLSNWYFDLLLVQIVVGAYLIWHSDGLHVKHFGSRELISVLDWALTDFLVTDSIAHRVFYSLFVLSDTVEFVTLKSVLVSL